MTLLAAYGAGMVIREAARVAYARLGRGTLTTDMLAELPQALANLARL